MLKAAYEAVAPNAASSFSVRTFAEEVFTAPYHYHPEYELTLIVQGRGRRYVGSHVAEYGPGDLVLVGAQLPHCWKTAPAGLQRAASVSVVAQFTHECLGEVFFGKPEMHAIAQLLRRSANGLHFPDAGQHLRPALRQLGQEPDPFRRLQALLGLLQALASTPHYEVLDAQQRVGTLAPAERERYHRVMAYLVEHFRGPLTLAQVAEVAHLTPNAFCKYFKNLTRRTFVEVMIEYRLQYATQQLVSTNKAVAEICYDSGFRDVSYFNKLFKAQRQHSPLQYRRAFQQALYS
ncbi:AraC family transcriptional regulator [Hymenobacter psoromatis]|uniref:AraC family transcriptional regulator n=1 Tax=Hymenobacter psoromatis TaxID=1484116 RepID=UPI001CBC634C|nr:AraC family transcriptional regulator [Hymenobacter psoromatis]